ncbi:hypothetical protein HN011_011916, partial [Eciton burchellii]
FSRRFLDCVRCDNSGGSISVDGRRVRSSRVEVTYGKFAGRVPAKCRELNCSPMVHILEVVSSRRNDLQMMNRPIQVKPADSENRG